MGGWLKIGNEVIVKLVSFLGSSRSSVNEGGDGFTKLLKIGQHKLHLLVGL